MPKATGKKATGKKATGKKATGKKATGKKATRKPGAGPIAPGWEHGERGHPDDELGFSWVPDATDAEDRLAHAAEELQRDNDARPLVKALLDLGLLPDAVRNHFQLWLDGELLPYPKISHQGRVHAGGRPRLSPDAVLSNQTRQAARERQAEGRARS